MAIVRIKKILENLKYASNTSSVVVKQAQQAHYASSGTAALAGTHAIYSTGL